MNRAPRRADEVRATSTELSAWQYPGRKPRAARRGVLLAVVVAALVVSGCDWRSALGDDPVVAAILGGGSIRGRDPNVVPNEDGSGVLADRVYVEAGARLAVGGAVEVGARVNATALSWQPAQHLFHYDMAPIGEWWTSTPIGPSEAGISAVRIRARRLDDGNLELTLLTPGGAEARPRIAQLPYTSLTADGWAYTTPVVLTADGDAAVLVRRSDVAHGGFSAISTGGSRGCGLGVDGGVECWGSARWTPERGLIAVSEPGMPDVPFVAVSGPCALRPEGDIACAGPVDGNPERLGPFVALSDNPGCGIRPDGRIDCWFNPSADVDGYEVSFPPPPLGAFAAVSVSRDHGCGIRLDDTLDCWGSNEVELAFGDEISISDDSGQARPPGGRFTAVSAAAQHTCGIRPDGTVECWGGNDYGQSTPPAGTFTAIRGGGTRFEGHTCGLRPDGRGECWGGRWERYGEYFEQAPPPAPAGAFLALSGRGDEMCGLRPNGTVDCWWPVAYFEHIAGRAYVELSAEFPDDPLPRVELFHDITHVPGGHFGAIGAGGHHACGLRAGGTAACWGLEWHGQTVPPDGGFAALSVGGYHSCGLRADGAVECWGHNTHGQTTAPPRHLTAVDAGWQHTCGIGVEGTAYCWGDDSSGQAAALAGTFTAVSAGGRHTCGLRAGGEVACWGDTTHGQTTAPGGSFDAVTAGAQHTCALGADNRVICWGDDRAGQSSPPGGAFSAIGAGANYTCGLRPSGNIDCWGGDLNEYPPPAPPPQGPFAAIAAGSQIACGLRTDGTAECWIAAGRRRIDLPPSRTTTRVPPGTYRSLSAGAYHTCALTTSGPITCWGENNHAQATPPPGTHRHIASGSRHTCALDTAGTITCWGENTFGQTDAPPGHYTALAAGTYHTCALDTENEIICWGDDTYHQAASPGDTYTGLTAGERHTCALDTDGTITCWGDNTLGQAASPGGTYTALTAGRLHTCALNTDGAVACWGLGYDYDNTNPLDSDPPTKPPQGPFIALAAGARHTCALNTNNHIECWPHQGGSGGRYHETSYWSTWKDSRATPLSGQFTAVSAGRYHTCAIRPDGTINCWSANEPRTLTQEPLAE